MLFRRIKKAVMAFLLTAVSILSLSVATSSVVHARTNGGQEPWERHRERRWEREREREEMWRIRQMDRDRRLRYRMQNSVRVVGYYDRFGYFHAYGYYDRFGYFHPY
jgi:hypothetical protein